MSKLSQFPDKEMRLILIGKTGTGKSSAANTILGSNLFEVTDGLSSGTDQCGMQEKQRGNVILQVTDTPGVCDTHRKFEEVHREICKSLALVAPGPHAIIMCLRCDARFTDEEFGAYQQLKNLFGENLKDHMILLINGLKPTGPPDLEAAAKKTQNFGTVMNEIGSRKRIIMFNNTAAAEDREKQAIKLIDTVVDVFLENGGRCFQDDILERFEEELKRKSRETGKSRVELRLAALENNSSVNKDLQRALPKEKVKERGKGRWCTIL